MKKKMLSVALVLATLLSCICFTAYADNVPEYEVPCAGGAHFSVQLPEPVEIPYEGSAHGHGIKTNSGGLDTAQLLFKLEQEIKDAILAGKSSVDISGYSINPNSINLSMLGYFSPYFDNETDVYAYYTSPGGSDPYYVRLEITTEMSQAEAAAYFAAVDMEVSKISALMNQGKNDVDKAIILHDYLVYTAAYDMSVYDAPGSTPNLSYKSGGVIMKHLGVCNSYAYAYMYFMNRAGIECYVTSSGGMNHAWNIIKIGGNYYHADVTWDDPVPDSPGRVYHSHFLVSDGAIGTKRGGSSQYHYGWDRTDLVCSDTSYDNAYWTNISSNIVTDGNYSYYIADGGIYRRDNTNGTGGLLVDLGIWKTWSGSGWWIGTFSGISLQGREIYYNTSTEIRKINIDTLEDTLVYAPDLSEGYIYGNAIAGNTINYTVKKDANETGVMRSIELQGVHTHSYSAQVVAPGCETQGFTLYTCVCGDSAKKDYVEPLGHLWDGGTVILEPTESSEGELLYSCGRCGGTKSEVIPILTHTHNYEFYTVTDPTCTDDGYVTHTCSCGDSFTDSVIPALGHKWDGGKVTVKPTTSSEGVMTYTCEICGELKTETIEKLDHNHSYVPTVTAPTCIDEGFTTHSCTCGDSYVDSIVPPVGHKWDKGKVTVKPTTSAEGEKTFTCDVCGETKTEAVEKLPVEDICTHSFKNKYCIYCGAREPYSELVSVNYRRIKIVLDGQEIIPCDGAGKTVEPFIMASTGTTYLPLRAISQALGLDVVWKAETNTVELSSGGNVKTGAGPAGKSMGLRSTYITYRNIRIYLDGAKLSLVNNLGVTVDPFILNENSTVYLPLRIIGEALGLNVSWDGATSTVYLNSK